MKDNSFERAMSKIVGQAEAEQQLELRRARRARLMGRVRAVAKFALVAAVFAGIFYYRVELQTFVSEKLESKSKLAAVLEGDKTGPDGKPQGGAAATISKAADNANIRDQIVDEVSK